MVIPANHPLFPDYGIGPVQVFQDVHPAFDKVVAKPGRLNLQGELVYPHRVVVGHRAVFVADGQDPDQVRTLGADEGATGFCRFLGGSLVSLTVIKTFDISITLVIHSMNTAAATVVTHLPFIPSATETTYLGEYRRSSRVYLKSS